MKVKISESLQTRKNNFDIIRFVASFMVVWFHSYPLTLGIAGGADGLARLTGGQATFGGVAVSIFFIISGFLITMSYDRTKDFIRYTKARFLRIFPGVIFVVLLSVFVLGPILTTLTTKEYFTNYQTYKYLASISLFKMQYNLPGVFDTNIYPSAINGSLWTLWYEFLYYIVVGVLGATKLLNKKTAMVLFIYSFLCSFFNITDNNYVYLFMYFSAGMVFYFYRDSIHLSHKYALIAGIAFIVFTKFGLFNEGLTVFGAYLIFYLALGPVYKVANFSRFGDFSYGIYIFSFPIQQCVTLYYQNQLTPFKNFIISAPFVLICSFISWHLVENNFMKLKNKSFKTLIPFMNKR